MPFIHKLSRSQALLDHYPSIILRPRVIRWYSVGDLVHTVIEENRIPSLLRKNGFLLTIYDKPYEPCSNRRFSADRLCLFSFFQTVLVIASQCFMVFHLSELYTVLCLLFG